MKQNTLYFCLAALLFLALFTLARGQQQSAPATIIRAPEIGPELPALYAAALTKVNQDPEYIKAVEAVRKAQLAADKMLFDKIRELEPRIKAYADYLERIRNPAPTVNQQAGE